jgi:hypothetical protein
LVQAAVISVVLWGALVACNIADPIPVALVSAILPTIFSVERVKLSRGEDEIIATLTFDDRVRKGTPRELYEALPDAVREELNYFEFADLIEKLVAAGGAEESDPGKVIVYESGRRKLRLRFE